MDACDYVGRGYMGYCRCVGLQYKMSGVASHLILIGVWN